MLGAIIGDIAGSVYEWQNVRTKDFGPLFHPEAFYTDDTVGTSASAEALFGIPKEIGRKGWTYLPAKMRSILQVLYR